VVRQKYTVWGIIIEIHLKSGCITSRWWFLLTGYLHFPKNSRMEQHHFVFQTTFSFRRDNLLFRSSLYLSAAM